MLSKIYKITLTLFLLSLLNLTNSVRHSLQLTKDKTLQFLVIGDYGDIYARWQAQKTFYAINQDIKQNPVSFIVTTGDNIYQQGIAHPNDFVFDLMMFFFRHDPLRDVPIYPVLGNHDCLQDPQSEVDSKSSRGTWRMIDFQYSLEFDIDPDRNGDQLGLIFINSCALYCLNVQGDVSCDDFHTIPTKQQIQKYYKEIDDKLTQYKENHNMLWTGVVIHFPLFSDGDVDLDQIQLQKYLYPLMKKHKVDMYITGHSHTLQYLNYKYSWDEPYDKNQVKSMVRDNTSCEEHLQLIIDQNQGRNPQYNQGDYLHEFMVGAVGRSNLDSVCKDYQLRTKGNMMYGSSGAYTWGRVIVSTQKVSVEYYDRDLKKVVYKVDLWKKDQTDDNVLVEQ